MLDMFAQHRVEQGLAIATAGVVDLWAGPFADFVSEVQPEGRPARAGG